VIIVGFIINLTNVSESVLVLNHSKKRSALFMSL